MYVHLSPIFSKEKLDGREKCTGYSQEVEKNVQAGTTCLFILFKC